MSASTLRFFAVVLIVLAVALGGLAYVMSQSSHQQSTVAEQNNGDGATADQIKAVVATAPLVPYQAIKAEDVALVSLPVAPAQHFKTVDEVVGRKPVRAVDQGTPLSASVFSTPSALSKAIPPGTEAMSLSVSDVIAVGGFVKPGDFVDVLIYIRASGSEVDDTQARILLRNVRLLAYDQQLINGEASKDQDSRSRDRTAVVAVPERLMTRVMLGASIGELRLALRRSVEPDQKPSVLAMDETDQDASASQVALSPVGHSAVSAQPSSSADGSAGADMSDAERQEVGGVEQVITLQELAALKTEKQSQVTARSKAPARTRQRSTPTVEIYEGVDSHRISRPQ